MGHDVGVRRDGTLALCEDMGMRSPCPSANSATVFLCSVLVWCEKI